MFFKTERGKVSKIRCNVIFPLSFQLAVEVFDYQDALIDLEKASKCYV